MVDAPPKKIHRRKYFPYVGIGIVLAVMLPFILFCSGINFPVINAQASLQNALKNDFDIVMPGSLKVLHAARRATRDPEYYYECDLAESEFAAFRAAVESSARKKGKRVDLMGNNGHFSAGNAAPEWYTPGKYADIEKVQVNGPMGEPEYWFFFSARDHKVFVFWYSP